MKATRKASSLIDSIDRLEATVFFIGLTIAFVPEGLMATVTVGSNSCGLRKVFIKSVLPIRLV